MKNLKLKSKLLITFLIIAIMTVVVGTIGIISMIVLDGNSQSVYDIAVKNAIDVNNMHRALSGVMIQNEKLFIMTSIGMGAAIFVALLLAILMATRLSKTIARPIMALESVFVKVGQKGNLNFSEVEKEHVRAFGKTEDEIGILVRSFTLMMENLIAQVSILEVVATGDLAKRARLASPDDTLGKAINTVISNLRLMVMEVREATAQLGSGAAQLSAGAQSLAQSSAEQSAAVEQIRVAISDIAKRAEENAARACQAQELAEYIRNSAEGGSEQMSRMISAMDEINTASRSIATVMKAIDDIAFQTNILSLNAAVEAARAGQHGKGFAVVADEVRRLASRSADAAKDTDALITNTLEKSRQGEEIVKETSDYLNTIVSGINNSSGLVVDIAGSAMEQKTAIDEMNRGISRLTDVVYQNSATAQQSAAASDQISNQANLLIDMVDRFIVQGAEADRLPSLKAPDSSEGPRKGLPDQVFKPAGSRMPKPENAFMRLQDETEKSASVQTGYGTVARLGEGHGGFETPVTTMPKPENAFMRLQDEREERESVQAEYENLLSQLSDKVEQSRREYGVVQGTPENADLGFQLKQEPFPVQSGYEPAPPEAWDVADPVRPVYEPAPPEAWDVADPARPVYEPVSPEPGEVADPVRPVYEPAPPEAWDVGDPVRPVYESASVRPGYVTDPVQPGYKPEGVQSGYTADPIQADYETAQPPLGNALLTSRLHPDILDAAYTGFLNGTQSGLNPNRIISVETSAQIQEGLPTAAQTSAQMQESLPTAAQTPAQIQEGLPTAAETPMQAQEGQMTVSETSMRNPQPQPYAANAWEDDISKY